MSDNDMLVTIDIKVAQAVLLCILIIVLIVLAIYAIYAIFNLVKTLKKSQKVLDDFEIVSHIASERTQELDKLIAQIQKRIKSGQTIFSSIPIIFSTIGKIAKVVSQQNARKAENGKDEKSDNK